MRINIQNKLFASYLLVAVLCTILLVGLSIYAVIENFEFYSQQETLDPVEKLILSLFNEGKIPDFRYIPRSMEDQFFTSVSLSLVITGLGTIFIAIVLSWSFSRSIVRPTRKMIAITKEIADGNYSKRVDIRSRDELGDLAMALNKMAEGLEKIESMRKELVSNVSHELATPLTNISGYLEALHDKVIEGKEPTEKTLILLREEANRLTSMVDDLRRLSKIESAGYRLTTEPLNLGEITDEIIFNFIPRIESKELNISTDIPGNLPPIRADKNALIQILSNLIDNAIAYTNNGGMIKISANQINRSVEISVNDNGIGISDKDMTHIFERFYRADKSRSRETGGTGIGLAIVKELVNQLGGRIHVKSVPDKGSTFTFTLPCT